MLCAWILTGHGTVCFLHDILLVDVFHHMLPTCIVSPGCRLLTNGLSLMGMPQVMCRSQHVRGRLIPCAWFWTRHCTSCLLHDLMLFVVLHHM